MSEGTFCSIYDAKKYRERQERAPHYDCYLTTVPNIDDGFEYKDEKNERVIAGLVSNRVVIYAEPNTTVVLLLLDVI